MDGFQRIGLALNTPQYWISLLIAVAMVVIGIWMLYAAFTEPQKLHQKTNPYLLGGGLVTFGILFAFLSRRWYNLVRTNPRSARFAGIMDVLNMTR
jgi:hypothetical protein